MLPTVAARRKNSRELDRDSALTRTFRDTLQATRENRRPNFSRSVALSFRDDARVAKNLLKNQTHQTLARGCRRRRDV